VIERSENPVPDSLPQAVIYIRPYSPPQYPLPPTAYHPSPSPLPLISRPSPPLTAPHPKTKRTRHDTPRHNGLKNQRPPHPPRRIALLAHLQRITNNDENTTEQLPASPADRTRRLLPGGPRDFDEPLQGHRHEAEGGAAHDAEDDVGGDPGAGAGGPDEGEVGEEDDGDEGFDEGEVGFCAVDDGGGDGGADEADEDEQGACDAGGCFGEVVGGEDLG